ncbi:MFS transporter [Nonomuraea turcica]|uniref:MFS transporter n=1 Tax=Nonomuraea sp. G32 TaxID=3067274 RepID=UPI00273C3D50|nr:MFS transporter [Nonomuraea sp. G32]MDP4500965.1 MFS transporter [Nonomuraea sp. G32]
MRPRPAVAVLAAGVAASMALGEFIPFLTVVGEEFALSLTTAGWLSSLITLVAGLACLPLGIWVDRRRLRGLFVAALVALGAAGVGAAFLGSTEMLFAVRVIQAAGYALVVIIGPSLLVRLLEGRARQTALALWGLCIPAGLALANAAGSLAGAAGWRAQVAGVGLLTLGVAVLAGTLPPDSRPSRVEDHDRLGEPGAGWAVAALAAGFAMIALVGVSVVTVLPTYLMGEMRLTGSQASLLAGLVPAASMLGSLAASAALRAGARPGRLIAAALLMAPLSAGVFLAAPVAVVALCAAGVLALNGLAVSAVFAALPGVASGRVAWGVGAVTQLGSLGTLLGPPFYGWCVEMSGWSSAIAVTAAIAAGGVGFALAAVRRRLP